MRNVPKDFVAMIYKASAKDMRIGQVMSNAFSLAKDNGEDPFYLENEEMMEYVRQATGG